MASTYLTRTPGTGQTSRTKGTLSVWLKRAKTDEEDFIFNGFESSSNQIKITFKSDAKLQINTIQSGSNHLVYETNRLFRDTSAWYHIVIAIDTTLATAGDRCRLYVNGVEETSFSTETHFSQNDLSFLTEDNRIIYIGSQQGTANYFDGSMSHYHLIDGTQYQASDFGEFDANGVWKIKTSPSVNYGTHGFFILKDGNSVTDQSGNGNDCTVGGGTLTNTEDSPSNVFATNNSLWKQESSRYLTHTKGNTMISGGGSATWYQTPATLAFNSGKFYWECKFNSGTNLFKNTVGVIDVEKTQESGQFQDKIGSVFFKNEDGGDYRLDNSNVDSNWGTLAQNDILGVAVDMDAGTPTVKYYKNGTLLGTVNASSLSGKFVTPAHMIYTSGEYQVNYGNGYFGTTAVSSAGTNASGIGIFEYDVPTGYTALSTKGLNL